MIRFYSSRFIGRKDQTSKLPEEREHLVKKEEGEESSVKIYSEEELEARYNHRGLSLRSAYVCTALCDFTGYVIRTIG